MQASTKGFFMVPKSSCENIAKLVEGRDAKNAFAVYVALRWVANNKGRPDGPFEAAIGEIAIRALLSYSTTSKALNLLEAIGEVTITRRNVEGRKEKAPSIYSLCTHCRGLVNPEGTLASPEGRLGKNVSDGLTENKKEPKEQEQLGESASLSPERSPSEKLRGRDPLLSVLARIDGSDTQQVTPSAWGGYAKALREIRAVTPDISEAEIYRRQRNYHLHFPDAKITPHALAKHWARLDKPPAGAVEARPEMPLRKVCAA